MSVWRRVSCPRGVLTSPGKRGLYHVGAQHCPVVACVRHAGATVTTALVGHYDDATSSHPVRYPAHHLPSPLTCNNNSNSSLTRYNSLDRSNTALVYKTTSMSAAMRGDEGFAEEAELLLALSTPQPYSMSAASASPPRPARHAGRVNVPELLRRPRWRHALAESRASVKPKPPYYVQRVQQLYRQLELAYHKGFAMKDDEAQVLHWLLRQLAPCHSDALLVLLEHGFVVLRPQLQRTDGGVSDVIAEQDTTKGTPTTAWLEKLLLPALCTLLRRRALEVHATQALHATNLLLHGSATAVWASCAALELCYHARHSLSSVQYLQAMDLLLRLYLAASPYARLLRGAVLNDALCYCLEMLYPSSQASSPAPPQQPTAAPSSSVFEGGYNVLQLMQQCLTLAWHELQPVVREAVLGVLVQRKSAKGVPGYLRQQRLSSSHSRAIALAKVEAALRVRTESDRFALPKVDRAALRGVLRRTLSDIPFTKASSSPLYADPASSDAQFTVPSSATAISVSLSELVRCTSLRYLTRVAALYQAALGLTALYEVHAMSETARLRKLPLIGYPLLARLLQSHTATSSSSPVTSDTTRETAIRANLASLMRLLPFCNVLEVVPTVLAWLADTPCVTGGGTSHHANVRAERREAVVIRCVCHHTPMQLIPVVTAQLCASRVDCVYALRPSALRLLVALIAAVPPGALPSATSGHVQRLLAQEAEKALAFRAEAAATYELRRDLLHLVTQRACGSEWTVGGGKRCLSASREMTHDGVPDGPHRVVCMHSMLHSVGGELQVLRRMAALQGHALRISPPRRALVERTETFIERTNDHSSES